VLSETERAPDRFLTLFAALSAMFALAYLLFLRSSGWIVGDKPPLTTAIVNPWMFGLVGEFDGIELPVATVASLVYFGLAAAVVRWGSSWRLARSLPLQLLGIGAAAWVLLRIRSLEFPADPFHLPNVAFALGAMLLTLAWSAIATGAASRIAAGFAVMLGALFAALVLASLLPASAYDYGYYLAPALKLLQGDQLGSFHMQYSLFGTLLFAVLIEFGLVLPQMQFVVALLIIVSFLLYYRLARQLMRIELVVPFMVAVATTRFLWIMAHPAQTPQSTAIRLELWLPLMLVVQRYGLGSWKTAVAFSVVYLADATFGLLYLVVYLAGAAIAFALQSHARRSLAWGEVATVLAPAVTAIGVQWLYLGGAYSAAAQQYASFRLGFLPIPAGSLFWGILFLLTLSLWKLMGEKDPRRREVRLFLFGICAVQLVYFYGRSRDHNLLNISGVLLLVMFVALDSWTSRRRAWLAGVAAVGLIGFAASERALEKLSRVASGFDAPGVYRNHELEAAVDAIGDRWPKGDPHVLLMDCEDGYLNYRLGLRQHGYFTPFCSAILLEDTAEALVEEIDRGARPVILRSGYFGFVLAANRTSYMSSRRLLFRIRKVGGVDEVVLDRRPVQKVSSIPAS